MGIYVGHNHLIQETKSLPQLFNITLPQSVKDKVIYNMLRVIHIIIPMFGCSFIYISDMKMKVCVQTNLLGGEYNLLGWGNNLLVGEKIIHWVGENTLLGGGKYFTGWVKGNCPPS